VFNVEAIERGKADVAFTQVDVAYFAYSRGTDRNPQPHSRLRAMAVIYVNTAHILARRDGPVRRVSDFRGRRIGVGLAGSGTEVATRVIIEGHDLQYSEVNAEFLSFADIATHLRDGSLDAGVIVSSYPVPAITDVAEVDGVRLIPVSRETARRIRTSYPFFRPVVIPKGTYRNQDTEIETIGVDNLLVCRHDLPDELVYAMTKALFEALPELAATHRAAAIIDPDQAPATPIPLHPGAARYYRERELLQ
jgi:TRAP transporter TAXI family solute receptor